jgi:exopolysaccharide production protein ExoQ
LLLSVISFVLPLAFLAMYFVVDEQTLSTIKNLLLLGRNTEVGTFTGRLPMWLILIKYAAKQPFLGYGYDSFWSVGRMSAIMASEGAWVGSDHSTYFNIALGLGVIGLGAFLCILSLAFARSIKLFRKYHDVTFAFSASILLLMATNMFLETTWFQPYMTSFLGMIILTKLAFKERAGEIEGRDVKYSLNNPSRYAKFQAVGGLYT